MGLDSSVPEKLVHAIPVVRMAKVSHLCMLVHTRANSGLGLAHSMEIYIRALHGRLELDSVSTSSLFTLHLETAFSVF